MTNGVFICKADAYDAANEAVERIFANSECTKALNADTRVCVKVNMLGRHKPQDAVTTHPAVLRAVIMALQKRGVQSENITVADSSGGVYNTQTINAIYKITGTAEVCAETGVQLYSDCKWSTKKAENTVKVQSFNIIEPVLQSDFIVNVPKLKTHMMMKLTNAVKNNFGVIPGLQKAEMHMRFPLADDFGNMLVDLYETVKPQLNIIDAVECMEGNGPNSGTPRHIGLIMGGENAYTLDLAACRITGLAPNDVPYLKQAILRGLCPQSLAETEINGDADALCYAEGYKLPAGAANATFAAAQHGIKRRVVALGEKLAAPHPKINTSKCIGCGRCAEICPAHTITLANKKAHIAPKACIRCFCCHEVCPADAINVKRFSLFNL